MILFICTGNTCRSPMAAGYLHKLLKDRGIKEIDVRSAGVMTISGLLASQEAIQVMDKEDVDLRRHRSSQLTPDLIAKADLVLAMSPFHRQTALRMSEEAKHKTHLFKEFSRSDTKNVQIADPMGGTLEVFKKCFKEIKAACEKLIDHDYIQPNKKRQEKKRPARSARGGGGGRTTPARKRPNSSKAAKTSSRKRSSTTTRKSNTSASRTSEASKSKGRAASGRKQGRTSSAKAGRSGKK